MAATAPAPNAPSPGMKYIWGAFCTWDKKAIELKSKITRWRSTILLLTIVGTVLATLSQQFPQPATQAVLTLPKGLGFASAICLGLAGFFTREVLKPATQSEQVRTRSAAEGLKTEAYLLAAGAPPYDTATGDEVLAKAQKIREAVHDLTPAALTDAEKLQGIPPENMTVDRYIAARVDDQINTFYNPAASANAKRVNSGQTISMILGGLAIVLGVLGALAGWVAGWITVIGTVVAAIMAYQYAGRYQFLVVSYLATADRLERLKAGWALSGKTNTDKAERDKFILACEEAISIENSSWMAEYTKADNAKP